jgi:hypothetical protein
MSQHGTNSLYGVMRHLQAAAAYRSKRLRASLELAFPVCRPPSNYVRREPTTAGKADAPPPGLPFMGTAPSVEYAR